MSGFGAGFEHPLVGLDHLTAMLAVGVWGAQRGGKAVWMLPATFPLVMVFGGLLALLGIWIPEVQLGIAVSILALGAAIFAVWRPAEHIMLFPIAVFAVFHGWAHGYELPQETNPLLYATGFVLATGMIHVIGVFLGLKAFARWQAEFPDAGASCKSVLPAVERAFLNTVKELTDRLASVLRELGSHRAWVVHADDGLDELSTLGPTRVSELKDGDKFKIGKAVLRIKML